MTRFRVIIEYQVDAEDEDEALDEAILGAVDASYVEIVPIFIGESE